MPRLFISFFAGLLFGAGLLISDMANPFRVIGFLDVTGTWDPTLLFVMGGAVIVAAPLFAWSARRSFSWSGDRLPERPRLEISPALIVGSSLFGLGWGLIGYCPGPALVAMATGTPAAVLFVTTMAMGAMLANRVRQHSTT